MRQRPERGALVEREPTHRRGVGALVVLALGVVLGLTVWHLPREHAPLSRVAREALVVALPGWHTLEPVNEVVYGTRGFDTFGETFLLLAAVVGIGLIARTREQRGEFLGEELAAAREQHAELASSDDAGPEVRARAAEAGEQGRGRGPATPDAEPLGRAWPERSRAMTVVVRAGVRVLAPLLTICGCYLFAWGYSPGGGFPGGAVLVGIVLLAYVSLGYRRVQRVIRPAPVEVAELLGALLVVAVELGGLIFKGSFSASFLPLGQVQTIPSGGVLQAFSASEVIEVATGLTLAIFGLLGMAHDWAPPAEHRDEGSSRAPEEGRAPS
ncbi:MAG TPA: MnhB domain-containing protein [Acidimicrobiales bacterium]|nr:MnhB domain-containing protein [Acidimicrobiales bacterium]